MFFETPASNLSAAASLNPLQVSYRSLNLDEYIYAEISWAGASDIFIKALDNT